MLRVTGWCLGLFGTGAAVANTFPVAWVQPAVLLALGIAFLFVSRTGARPPAHAAEATQARAPQAKAAPRPTATPAPVPVEQSA